MSEVSEQPPPPEVCASFSLHILTRSLTEPSRSPFNLADSVAQHGMQHQPSAIELARFCAQTKGQLLLPVWVDPLTLQLPQLRVFKLSVNQGKTPSSSCHFPPRLFSQSLLYSNMLLSETGSFCLLMPPTASRGWKSWPVLRLRGVCGWHSHTRSYFCSPQGEARSATQRSGSTSVGLKEEECRRLQPESDDRCV